MGAPCRMRRGRRPQHRSGQTCTAQRLRRDELPAAARALPRRHDGVQSDGAACSSGAGLQPYDPVFYVWNEQMYSTCALAWAMAKPSSPIATGRYRCRGGGLETHRQVPSQSSPGGIRPIVVGEPSTPARSAERCEMGGETEGDPNHRRWCRPTQMDTQRTRRRSEEDVWKPRGIMIERGGNVTSSTFGRSPEVEDGCPSTAL